MVIYKDSLFKITNYKKLSFANRNSYKTRISLFVILSEAKTRLISPLGGIFIDKVNKETQNTSRSFCKPQAK